MTQTAQKTKDNATALAVVPPARKNELARLDMADLKELGEMFHASGAFTDVKSAAAAMVKIHAGHELGFTPIQSMTGIHFFQGKVSIGSTLIASLIKDSGRYDYEILEHTSETCSVQFKQLRGGEWLPMGVPVAYTVAEARAAGLGGNPAWKNHPADMLFASCIRKGARRYTPDIFRGTAAVNDSAYDDAIDAVDIQTAQNSPATYPQVPAAPSRDAAPSSDEDAIDAEPTDEEPNTDPVPESSEAADLIAAINDLFNEKWSGHEQKQKFSNRRTS